MALEGMVLSMLLNARFRFLGVDCKAGINSLSLGRTHPERERGNSIPLFRCNEKFSSLVFLSLGLWIHKIESFLRFDRLRRSEDDGSLLSPFAAKGS
jgi:hypothetical protein